MKENVILEVAKKHNLEIKDFDNYTNEIIKIIDYKKSLDLGKLVVVTSMSPTPVGEGKTTTSIGLVDGLNSIGVKAIGALREPSLGPVFGMKGTGSGSNKAMLLPFDKINLHFTGDIHAITSANNLISAVIENEIYQNSDLNIDPNNIVWKRCIDMNDRGLRDVNLPTFNANHETIKTSFNITAASDLMALFCLSKNRKDFEQKINNTIVAYSRTKEPVTIKDLEIKAAIMAILNDAFYPNLVRTLEDNPVLVHGGPFANIAHGCSSLISITTGLELADVVVTECGFGSDLGLEKFMDITAVEGDLHPALIVLVISLKSIIYNGQNNGINPNLTTNKQKINEGFKNVLHHINHCKQYGVELVVAINHRDEDKLEDLQQLKLLLDKQHVKYSVNDCWSKGSNGAHDLAEKVQAALQKNSSPKKHKTLYKQTDDLLTKIKSICKTAYGANEVQLNDLAKTKLETYKQFSNYYVCISKNPYSLTCDPKILGKPTNFATTIEDIEINHAAKLIIPITSVVYRMPGLPKKPAAKNFIMK